MRNYILFFVLVLVVHTSYGQQDPLYSQYLNNPIVLNPAYAGVNNIFSASAGYRTQWRGLDGSPTTAVVSAHSSLLNNKVGAGLTIIRDELGATTNTQINIAGAYKIEFGDNVFSFGLQSGINNYKEDNSQLEVRDPGDPLFTGNQSFTKVNFGAGAIVKGPRYFVGLSIPRLVNSKEQIDNIETEIYSRHYYLALGYYFQLGANLGLKAATMVKAVSDVPASIDYSATALFLDRFSAGLMSRNFETYGLMVGMQISENLRFGYTFEVPTNQSVGSKFNSHELSLTLDMEVFDFHFLSDRYF
ncbi:MAG TPA: type IX secretion system membrane protein PorP/SprF [Fulvivirga sp.]|nr:type IX secretion system membrane protein PorP/SprF [Fulvivirga sp.]